MNILITCAGRRVSLVRAFRKASTERGGMVMVADHDIHAPALMAADRAVHLPELGDAAYADRLLDAIRLHDIGLLVPTIDTELPILAALAGNRRTGDCRFAVSSTSFVELAADKLATASNFQAAGIAVPDTWVPDEIPDLPAGRRWIVKPRFGSSSIGVLQVETSLVKAAIQIVDRPVIQSCLDGQEVTVDVLFDWEGRVIHYVPRLRIKTLGGESIQGVTITTDGWRTWLEDVLDKLGSMGACGVITVQVFLTEQGPVLLEINPRFGGGFPLSLKAGALYPSWLLKLAAGEDVATRLGDYRIGVRMARFMEECYTEK